MTNVVIISAGGGNIHSVSKALTTLKANVVISNDPDTIFKADKIVLPGVGAFGHCMNALKKNGIDKVIQKSLACNKPFLGICVGMQVLFDLGEEFGKHQGFGFFPGKVVAIADDLPASYTHKIPHIGWYQLKTQKITTSPNLLSGIDTSKAYVYLLHSYMAEAQVKSDVVCSYQVGDTLIPALINRGNIWGCQFHPEKSGEVGLKIFQNFLQL